MNFFPADPRQALRFRRTLLGLTGYLLAWVMLGFGFLLGRFEVTGTTLAAVIFLSLLGNVFFLVMIGFGWNRKWFRDPSMTLLQVSLALTWLIWILYAAPDLRGIMSILLIPSFIFGVFRFRRRVYVRLAGAVSVAYGLVLLYDYFTPARSDPGALGLLAWLTLTGILFWFAVIGGYVSGLRERLASYANELEEARDKLAELAVRDELTGLFNRRHIVDVLHREHERALRFGSPFAIVMVDLDRFKRINDTYGHLAGDDLLAEFSARIQKTIRAMDWAGRNDQELGRFGGEEFILILPETGCEGAVQCAERIRETVAGTPFDTRAGKIPVTLSAGVACYRKDETFEETLHRADERLYAAKAAGRNCVVSEG